MNKQELTILFSGQSDAVRHSFKNFFENKGITVHFSSKNGNEIVQAIQQLQPQVVVLDVFLSGIDAIGVKTQCEKMPYCPKIFFAMESCGNEMLEAALMSAKFAYCFLKPVSADYILSIIERITDSDYSAPGSNIEYTVSETLYNLGVPAHMKGYNLLRQSIIMTVENPDAITLITKRLYPNLAKVNNTTASRVERAMRHAISTAWDRGNVDMLNDYFGYTVSNMRGKPTNREFIAIVSERIRISTKKKSAK